MNTAAAATADSILRDEIVQRILEADPDAVQASVAAAVAATADTVLRQRQIARALADRPEILHDGRPPGPQRLGELLLLLRRTSAAAVAAPACRGCGRPLSSVRGASWCCDGCRTPVHDCAGCGQACRKTTRDETGLRRCRKCAPLPEQPDWATLATAVQGIDPDADRAAIRTAARRVAPGLARQRALIAAVAADPGVLSGRAAGAPVRTVLRLIDSLTEAGVTGMVRPSCPRCGRVVALVKWHDASWICARCDRTVRAAPCAECGAVREVSSRDRRGRPLCGSCHGRDPVNTELCVRCGHRRPVNNRTPEGPVCASCRPRATVRCTLCGQVAPGSRSALTGQPRCQACQGRRLRCGGCGEIRAPYSGTLEDPRCGLCTPARPDAARRRRHQCRSCGLPQPNAGLCPTCQLIASARPLLIVGDAVRPELLPLLAWWRKADRPGSVRTWLARRPAARTLLRQLADGTVALSHEGLDQVPDTKTVRYVRRILVAAEVLPADDEHLRRLERWLNHTIATIADLEHRRIVHRYAVWYHLRRLRARTSAQRPVSDGQATRIRDHVRAAAAVLSTLADSGRILADLRYTDVDLWLAGHQVARRAELSTFLNWARRERLTTVAIPAAQWAGPHHHIDHDQRWTIARRLLNDETLPAEDRLAGLLVVLYAQTATSIRLLRFDDLHVSPDGVRLTFGTTPIDLPKAMIHLLSRLTEQRIGTDRATTPWVFPGRPWNQPISTDMLRKRLAALGVFPQSARIAAMFQLAVELPAAVLARCLGIDISSAVVWQRTASGDWRSCAARLTAPH